jgi:C1A family cysteine protease
MNKRTIATLLAVLVAASVFTVALPVIASESLSTPSTAEPSVELAGLQQRIYSQGYSYTVAENGITQLSPEERQLLCGYKPLTPPTKPLPENIRFRPADELPRTMTMVTQSSVEVEQLPATYDAMALGYVTPVRNQGACGSCWIFAVTADFESDVLINASQGFNFAEQEVGDCNIWSSVGGYNFCDGGAALMAINLFTRYGAADEACHPYVARSQTCLNCPPLKTVNNWRSITGGYGESEITLIKNAILNYGPVYATIYAGDSGFSAYNGGVYEYWGSNVPNHAVEIIGWNDALQHSHGTGAWLIKNSWGTNWARNGPYPGCAWVAYGSANLGDWASAIAGYEDASSEEIFYHDECGWMGYVMGCGKPTAYGAVRFVPSQNATLTAVDFWVIDTDMAYEIEIFDTIQTYPEYYAFSDLLGTTQAGTTDEEGYYSIPLDTPVELREGDDVIVQVNFTTTRYGYPIPIDYYTDSYLPPWSTVATFSGESYGSCDGLQFGKPYDSYSGDYYDVGIRARAEEVPNQPPAAIIDSITPDPAEQVADTVSFTGHGTDTDGTVVTYNWSSSIDGPLSIASSFTKPASELSPGTHTISFQVQDDDDAWSTATTENVTIVPLDLTRAFDTGAGTYPGISGIHNGTITPNQTMQVQKLYTYPCSGTGGHSEYVRIWGNGVDKNASWTGYSGDWHNISFNETFVLYKNETYNYTIRAGSYPLMHHTNALPTANGWINCTEFTDANGKEYDNWIPAIRFE